MATRCSVTMTRLPLLCQIKSIKDLSAPPWPILQHLRGYQKITTYGRRVSMRRPKNSWKEKRDLKMCLSGVQVRLKTRVWYPKQRNKGRSMRYMDLKSTRPQNPGRSATPRTLTRSMRPKIQGVAYSRSRSNSNRICKSASCLFQVAQISQCCNSDSKLELSMCLCSGQDCLRMLRLEIRDLESFAHSAFCLLSRKCYQRRTLLTLACILVMFSVSKAIADCHLR